MARTPVSIRSLGRKVDQLAEEIKQDRAETTKLKERVDVLNGSKDAIRQVALAAPQLLKLAAASDVIIETVTERQDRDAAMRWFRRVLNPLKPVGGLFWAVIGTLVAALLWNYLTTHH